MYNKKLIKNIIYKIFYKILYAAEVVRNKIKRLRQKPICLKHFNNEPLNTSNISSFYQTHIKHEKTIKKKGRIKYLFIPVLKLIMACAGGCRRSGSGSLGSLLSSPV